MKAERAAWREEFAAIDPARLVFLDESGANTAMARRHGRAPRGLRVDGPVPHGHWKTVTLTAAVRLGGVGACLAFDGATNTACFEAYVERVPGADPAARRHRGDGQPVVPQDGRGRPRLIAGGRGGGALPAGVQPGPQPDREDVQQAQGAAPQGGGADGRRLIEAMGDALRAVTPQDIAGWFGSCGYATPKRKPL